jgi:putative ABC transport system permease protein
MSILPVPTIFYATIACLAGAMLYRFAVAFALNTDFLGLQASDVQLVTAALVVLTLVGQRRSGWMRILGWKPAQ